MIIIPTPASLVCPVFSMILTGQMYICSLPGRGNVVQKLHLSQPLNNMHKSEPLRLQSSEPIPFESAAKIQIGFYFMDKAVPANHLEPQIML